jgi:hypothetical protein
MSQICTHGSNKGVAPTVDQWRGTARMEGGADGPDYQIVLILGQRNCWRDEVVKVLVSAGMRDGKTSKISNRLPPE